MNTNLKKIMKWVKINSPQTIKNLNPPATDYEITQVEKATNLILPPSFKNLLKTFNGEKGENWLAILGNGNQLLPCSEIIEQYQLEQEIAEQIFDKTLENKDCWRELVAKNILFVQGTVKPLTKHPQWLPITCMNGDVFRYLDFDPAPGGSTGQVIEVDIEACSYQVLANSFQELIGIYADDLSKGKYKVAEDGFIESSEEKEVDGGMPEWLM